MIKCNTPKHHWNYFLAIEKDLENISRYIEFDKDNYNVYSIELAHILLSASSEVDTIMKQLCKLLDPNEETKNIDGYRLIIQNKTPSFINEEISIDRFGLLFKPWDNWVGTQNPNWWKSYNNVKHQRDSYFKEANLQNTINAVGALLLTTVYYYKYSFSNGVNNIDMKDVTRELNPESSFIKINADYYYHHLVCR